LKLEPTPHDEEVVPERGQCEDAVVKGDPPVHTVWISPCQTGDTIINVQPPMMQRNVEHHSASIAQEELRGAVGLVAGEHKPLVVTTGTNTKWVRYTDLAALAKATRQCYVGGCVEHWCDCQEM